MMTMIQTENPYGPITLNVLFNVWIDLEPKNEIRVKVKKKG